MFASDTERSSALATAPTRFAMEFDSVATDAPRCLIVARHEERRLQLADAAERCGWEVVDLDDIERAFETIDRYIFELAVIDGVAEGDYGSMSDMQNSDVSEEAELTRLVETVAAQRKALVAVCGEEGNAPQEIWARGLGAWLYLTGELDSESLPYMFDAAREATEQVVRAREGKHQWRRATTAA